MSCLYKILILSDYYHAYEQATQWAYVNITTDSCQIK